MSSEVEKSPEKPVIFIVDDTPQNIQMLGTALKSRGFQVAVANNGIQALERVHKVQPDLILLDIMMPEMDGFEVCSRMQSEPELKEIPIVFLTAKTATDDVVKGLNMGAVDYVTKPINLTELLARINTHLELKSNRDKLRKAHDTIELISNERRELLHILCHDLANPVHSIISSLNIVKKKPKFFSDEVRDEMLRVAKHSMDVINLVRKMRALEDNKIKLEIESVNLNEVISEARRILEVKLKEKNISLEISVSDNVEVIAEKISLVNSILNNLFTNAIKFSYPGSTVKIHSEENDERINLYITDTGIGIPEHILENVFNLGIHRSRKGTSGENGTGYGLPLVSKFMKAYGGDITLESKDISNYPDEHGTTTILSFNKGNKDNSDAN